jgi:hypothetical protein
MVSCVLASAPGTQEAYRRMGEILSRKEFRGWVNPVELILNFFNKFQKLFGSLPAAVQIIVMAALLLILALIVLHWITIIRRFLAARSAPPGSRGEDDLEALLRTKLAPKEIKEKALACLERGETKEAVRLLYVYFILLLRRRGMIPDLQSLTAREIIALARKQIEDFDRATNLFERSSYSPHPVGGDEGSWMLRFVEEHEG